MSVLRTSAVTAVDSRRPDFSRGSGEYRAAVRISTGRWTEQIVPAAIAEKMDGGQRSRLFDYTAESAIETAALCIEEYV